jgi:hypothetical protein
MAGPSNSLSASISSADRQLTVLDDRVDVEDHAVFLWLRAHRLYGYAHHRLAIGTEFLTADWNNRKKKFFDQHSARMYLRHFVHSSSAMSALRTLARSLSLDSGTLSDTKVLDVLAANLVSGRVWMIELPRSDLKSRFVSKTSGAVFAPLNPRFGTRVDFAFIASLEGDQWLRGYVPMKNDKVLGKSGMTVASGFDLGQWTVAEFQQFGFPAALMNKIRPFASPHRFKGMHKAQVAAMVAKLGPVPELTKVEADLCDGAVFGRILGDAIRAWNSAKGTAVPVFSKLPAGWQTVWLSRVYQEGPSPKSSDAIAFRNAATSGNWQQAIAKLRAYSDYKKRANAEADLLAKELPAPVAPGPASQTTPSPASASPASASPASASPTSTNSRPILP